MVSLLRSLVAALMSPLALLALVDAPAATGASRSLPASSVKGRTVVFDLKALKRGGGDVRRAALSIRRPPGRGHSAGPIRVAVSVSRVRRMAGRGRLRVLAPRHTSRRARRAARLVIVTSKARKDPGGCVAGTLKAGSWPGACWRPYSATSPFNTPPVAPPPPEGLPVPGGLPFLG